MSEFTELRIYADGDWRVVGAEHDIVTELHTAAGAEEWDVLGASGPDTLAWLAATASPGAAAALLRTDDAGKVTLEGLAVGRVNSSLIPALPDTYDLGDSTLLWRKGWLSELDAVLFAKNTKTLVGGWLSVGPDEGTFPADVAAADAQIEFGKAMTLGHFIEIRAAGKVEYMQVGSLVSGTTYNVARNLDGSGANDWPAGTVWADNGTIGSGRIEINAHDDTPRLSILLQGATYNAKTEVLRLGDLEGIDDPTLSPSGWGLYGQNVFLSGKITATGGSIAGWTIASGHLYAGSGGSRAGLQPASYPFYAGSEAPASAPFRVTPAGALIATNATITGAVTATSGSFTGAVIAQTGSIGGWTIATGHLYAGSGGTRAGLQPASYPFYAGSSTPSSAPFRVTPAGALVATNATLTGSLLAGNDLVSIDTGGHNLVAGSGGSASSIKWHSSSLAGATIGQIWGYQSSKAYMTVQAKGLSSGAPNSEITIEAQHYNLLAQNASLTLYSGTTPHAYLSGSLEVSGNLDVSGRMLMNCSASNFNTKGLTIDQATSDDDAITLKSYGDVLHGMTTWADTSTYGFLRKQDGSYGGLMMAGLRDGGTALAMNIFGFLNGTPATTKSAASFGVCHIGSAVQSGTTIGACGNNSNLLSIANYSNTRFIFDADGDLHMDSVTVVNAWDEHDDMALLTGLRAAAAPALRERFGQFIEQARPVLEATGVATFNEDGTVWYGVRALQMLTIDALRQFAVRTEARLERYERELLRLGVDPAKLIA